MRLGIYGGTFDPVHFGHLVLAEQCREQLSLDAVLLIPAGQPPHKPGRTITPGPQRSKMLEYAIAGHSQFRVDRRELQRTGPSYTVETLDEIQREDPARELFLLLGADSLFELPTWREPQRILSLATVVAVNRPGYPAPDLTPLRASLGPAAEQIRLITIPGCDLSASDLRGRAHAGKSLRYLVPRAVECFIEHHRLYRDA